MSLGSVVAKISPLLGSVLNAFIPGSGLIVSGLAHLFGVQGNDQEEIATAIANDPNATLKLKQFEIEHQDILVKMTQADSASARDMNIESLKATGKSDYMLHALGMGAFLMVFVYVLLGYFLPARFSENVFHDLLNICTFVFSFYFGGQYIQSRQMKTDDVQLPPPEQTR